jgi:hypothetical protein
MVVVIHVHTFLGATDETYGRAQTQRGKKLCNHGLDSVCSSKGSEGGATMGRSLPRGVDNPPRFYFYSRSRRNRKVFPMTETELSLIAPAAMMGLKSTPKHG